MGDRVKVVVVCSVEFRIVASMASSLMCMQIFFSNTLKIVELSECKIYKWLYVDDDLIVDS